MRSLLKSFFEGRGEGPLVVSCTRGRKEETDLYGSLVRLGADRVLFFENNRRGLPACYNSVLDDGAGRDEIIVFVHDDVAIDDTRFAAKLRTATRGDGHAVVGVAGTADFEIDPDDTRLMWMQPPETALSGGVTHRLADGALHLSGYGPAPRRCVVLDGLLLAVDRRKIGPVRFDERFPFHFYDLDFCLAANMAGLTVATTDIAVTHASTGSYDSEGFAQAQAAFVAKWKPGRYSIGVETASDAG